MPSCVQGHRALTGKMFQVIIKITIILSISDVCFSSIYKGCTNRAYNNEICYVGIFDLTNDIAHRSFWVKPADSFHSLTFIIPSSISDDLNLEREFQKGSFYINDWNNVLCTVFVKGNSTHLTSIEVAIFVNSYYYWKLKFDLKHVIERPTSLSQEFMRINFYFEGNSEYTDNYSITIPQKPDCKVITSEPLAVDINVKKDSENVANAVADTKEETEVFRTVPNCMMNRALFPVCGSDGNSYANFDAIKCVQDFEPELSVAYEGMCKFGDLRKKHGS